jgi:hypothetical protein
MAMNLNPDGYSSSEEDAMACSITKQREDLKFRHQERDEGLLEWGVNRVGGLI